MSSKKVGGKDAVQLMACKIRFKHPFEANVLCHHYYSNDYYYERKMTKLG